MFFDQGAAEGGAKGGFAAARQTEGEQGIAAADKIAGEQIGCQRRDESRLKMAV
jgi:hypothetical protein